MIVVTQRVEITQVPGHERIIIEVDEHSARGVQLLLVEDDASGGHVRSYGLQEARDLARCLDRAAQIGEAIATELEIQEKGTT